MSSITFEVKSIALNLDFRNTATWGCKTIQINGYMDCCGENGNRLIVYGLHPLSPRPATPVCIIPSAVGAIFVPFDQLKFFAAQFQQQQQIFARLDPDCPERMGLLTESGGFVSAAC